MLQAKKEALENSLRQRLVAIREKELLYYTENCRNIGNGASIISGLAYSGIRYHYLLERNTNYVESVRNSFEECLFLSLLAITLGCSLQTVFTSMLVALFGPQLALRGPDGSLHDAVEGMHRWNSVIIALFMTSLLLLQLSAFSLMYGHSQLNPVCRATLLSAVSLSVIACLHYARLIIRRLSLPKELRVSGAFFAHVPHDPISAHAGLEHEPFEDAAPSARKELSAARPPTRTAANATRIDGDEALPLTAEALDHAINEFYCGHPKAVGVASAQVPAEPGTGGGATAAAPPHACEERWRPSAASAGASAWGAFPACERALGGACAPAAEESDDDEEMPLNGRTSERPAVRIKRRPHRVPPTLGAQLRSLGGAAPTTEYVARRVSWREEFRLLHRVLFQPVLPERSLHERGGFGRDDYKKVVEQEALLSRMR